MRTRSLLWSAVAAYGAGFSALSILRHRSFTTGRFDLGNMVQAIWSTAHGDPLAITNLRGDQISRLAAHVDPILVAFAPLWWLWPSADLLFVTQAVAVALGAVPVFWLARKHLRSERAALGFALAYLFYPAVEWLTLNEFHPVALATPLLLYAFWFLDEERWLPFAACSVAAAACREEIPLVVAGFGLWYALSRKRWAPGLAVAGVGVLWTAVAVGVLIPHFRSGESPAFYARYSEVGGTPRGIVGTSLTDPVRVLETVFSGRSLDYVAELVLPLAGLALAAPLLLVAALPELAVNLLSANRFQTSIHFHYTAGLIPPLVAGSILGAARLTRGPERRRWGVRLGVGVAALGIAANYHLGPLPVWRFLVEGSVFQATDWRASAHDRAAARGVALVPGGVVVSASNRLGGHLSDRRRILSFPVVQDATWIAVDEVDGSYADRVAPIPASVQIAWLRQNPAWRLVYEQDGVLVFRRTLPP